jgi:hypothetical protein
MGVGIVDGGQQVGEPGGPGQWCRRRGGSAGLPLIASVTW